MMTRPLAEDEAWVWFSNQEPRLLLYLLGRESWLSRAPGVARCANNATTLLSDTGSGDCVKIRVRTVGSTPI